MEKSVLPYKQMLFVCTNARKPEERISCGGEGRCGVELLEKLKDYVKGHRLEKVARVVKSGCHEKCELGPNIVVMPQNIFISGLNSSDVDSVIATFLAPLKSS